MSTGGSKITEALLAKLAEKKDFYNRLKADQEILLAFIRNIEEKISLNIQNTLASSTSSIYKARGLSNTKSLEYEAEAAGGRLKALEARIGEIENKIKEFEKLLRG